MHVVKQKKIENLWECLKNDANVGKLVDRLYEVGFVWDDADNKEGNWVCFMKSDIVSKYLTDLSKVNAYRENSPYHVYQTEITEDMVKDARHEATDYCVYLTNPSEDPDNEVYLCMNNEIEVFFDLPESLEIIIPVEDVPEVSELFDKVYDILVNYVNNQRED